MSHPGRTHNGKTSVLFVARLSLPPQPSRFISMAHPDPKHLPIQESPQKVLRQGRTSLLKLRSRSRN